MAARRLCSRYRKAVGMTSLGCCCDVAGARNAGIAPRGREHPTSTSNVDGERPRQEARIAGAVGGVRHDGVLAPGERRSELQAPEASAVTTPMTMSPSTIETRLPGVAWPESIPEAYWGVPAVRPPPTSSGKVGDAALTFPDWSIATAEKS